MACVNHKDIKHKYTLLGTAPALDRSPETYTSGKPRYQTEVIIVGNDFARFQYIKTQLDEAFNIRDLGPIKCFLGIEVAKTDDGFVLSLRKYTLVILEDSGMMRKPSSFRIEQNLQLREGENEDQVGAGDQYC